MGFKIGMNLTEVRTAVSNNKNISDENKQAIFKFIDEDIDGKITNDIESAFLYKLMGEATSNKTYNLKVPDIPADSNGAKTVVMPESKDVVITRGNKEVQYWNTKTPIQVYTITNEKTEDTLFANQNSKIAFTRVVSVTNQNTTTSYYDNDLDGSFDIKAVNTNGYKFQYKKDENNQWVFDRNI